MFNVVYGKSLTLPGLFLSDTSRDQGITQNKYPTELTQVYHNSKDF